MTCNKTAFWMIAFALLSVASGASGQTFTTLHSFDGSDGLNPVAGMVQAIDGNLYGTTYDGGANKGGTVFQITPSGTLTTLYNFCSQTKCTDGANPDAALIQATDGNLYGTTYDGGTGNNGGSVFRITLNGALTTLYGFCKSGTCIDGAFPKAALIQATDGNFYGTTYEGGANRTAGSVFRITPSGTLTTLYSFCSQSSCTDSSNPLAGLVQATNGNLYGTTSDRNYFGSVFEITPSGTFTTLYSFCRRPNNCATGSNPLAGLVQATDGNLYGTTSVGGGGVADGGTVFKITPRARLTTLHIFDGTDGANPTAGLVQAADGNFYGTTFSGGTGTACTGGCGTVFEITPSGTLTTLHSFDGTDGANPTAGLVQATDGSFYGTTSSGGTSTACTGGCGTVFSLSVGLGPFVETLPSFGKVGASIKILGTNLTGVTAVSFNGTAATFTVVESSLITATVPTGASTGFVNVTTASSTLTSNQQFRIEP